MLIKIQNKIRDCPKRFAMQVLLSKKEMSTTQAYSPKYRKKLSKIYDNNELRLSSDNIEQIRDIIVADIKKIDGLIDGVDSIISNRVQFHEQEILKIVRQQLHKMQMDVDNVVLKYNQLLKQKSISEEIWELRGQLDAHKRVLIKLNQQNQKLRNQNKQLHMRLQTRQDKTDQQNQVLKKIMKKLLKQKQRHGNFKKKFMTQPRVDQNLMIQLNNNHNQSQISVKSSKNEKLRIDKSVHQSFKKWDKSMNCSKIARNKQTSVPLKMLKADGSTHAQEFQSYSINCNIKLSRLKNKVKSSQMNPQLDKTQSNKKQPKQLKKYFINKSQQ